jgi:hypothetical protein
MFPEIYMNGEKPARHGVIDKGRFSLRTPAYGFGWLLSSVELLKALNMSHRRFTKLLQLELPDVVEERVYAHWEMKGYDRKRHYK